MLAGRIGARSTRILFSQCRSSVPLLIRQKQPSSAGSPAFFYQYHSLVEKVVPGQVSLLHHSFLGGSPFQRFGISSSASPQENEKDAAQSSAEHDDSAKTSAETESSASKDDKDLSGSNVEPNSDPSGSVKRRRRSTKWFSLSNADSDSEVELSEVELVKVLAEKEEQLNLKVKEIQEMKEKALRTYAEMQNSMDRTKRDAENMKKFAIQDFVKNLLDVADNLGRASSAVKGNFLKIDESKDTVGAVPLLRTLLQGVEMTDKQLSEVFRKYGVQKYDPLDEEFDPNKHNAVFEVPDSSKPPGTIAAVLKAGYTLHDRVLRPAEVGVRRAVETEADQGSKN
ncbi:OLC1v1022637C1 [Oldenlandia corymbosa var. corymbosa]|uniref:GrpE protein homolog n=1 Tax=Oldenlandia corymbosa var. corymbosa TaxID=529605 RepID=A0AAV1BY97_OLDCO|nr:OLC1v1022637C1 [Oldenlandia corymbosa var. corymbosa]